jgi:hypothetical protein
VARVSVDLVIERAINFERRRRMRCGSCRHEWLVTAEWLARFNQALVGCPTCDTDCRGEDRPDFCEDPDEPMRDDAAVRDVYWYHSSTHENWPDPDFNPAAELTDETRQWMEAACGRGAVERWAARQKAKALHVGTYEAAIESMFRRMRDQADSRSQFYLYRVELEPDCVIELGVHKEPTNWVGDAYLSEVCSAGATVFRYLNVHEDKSNVSLAIEAHAIRAVQRIAIPLEIDRSNPWIAEATQRLLAAASKPSPAPAPGFRPWLVRAQSALRTEAIALGSEIAESLPSGVMDRFSLELDESAFATAPDAFPSKLVGMARLVTHPEDALRELDAQPWRACHTRAEDEIAS